MVNILLYQLLPDKNKKIDFANNIYSYRAKYPHLFIYPKKNFENNKKNYLLMTSNFL